MNKYVLIITNPGEEKTQGYCEGVNVDLKNYKEYFCSPLGGAWKNEEIISLTKPSVDELKLTLNKLKSIEYLVTIFCGHGYYCSKRESTILELKKGYEFDSIDLRIGVKKQLTILDCCRKVYPIMLSDSYEFAKAASKNYIKFNINDCRKLYEESIYNCSNSIVVLHSCNINEVAGDDGVKGGYYSSSLIKVAKNWADDQNINTLSNHRIRSVVDIHDNSLPMVSRLSNKTQNPQIEKPRTESHFPFAIIA